MAEIEEQYTVAVCTDCLLAHHNGEYPERDPFGDERPEPLELMHHNEILGMPDDDGYFSRFGCETCGVTLGGTRYDVTLTRFKSA